MNNDDDPNSVLRPDLPTLSAFVDDELPDAESAGVLARLANDPHAAAQVAAWRAQKSTLKALFSAPAHEDPSVVVHAPDPWW
ncbi:anti-sigma factor RsiW [Caballeronia udeis]|uniref:Anti-sigma factor RsiW n=1 Tax=Caballeronia udeis TaxID=1232866 RepID=A0ABW8MRQ6_9BURK